MVIILSAARIGNFGLTDTEGILNPVEIGNFSCQTSRLRRGRKICDGKHSDQRGFQNTTEAQAKLARALVTSRSLVCRTLHVHGETKSMQSPGCESRNSGEHSTASPLDKIYTNQLVAPPCKVNTAADKQLAVALSERDLATKRRQVRST